MNFFVLPLTPTLIKNPLYAQPKQPVTLTPNPLYESSGNLQHNNIKQKQQRLLELRQILQNPAAHSRPVLTQSSAEANTIRRQLANVMTNNFMGQRQLTRNVVRNKPAPTATSNGTYSGANFYSVGISASPTPTAPRSNHQGLESIQKKSVYNPQNKLNLIRTSTNKTNKQSLLNAHYRIVQEPMPYKNINSVHNAQKIIDFLEYKSRFKTLLNNTDQQLASYARAYIIQDEALHGKMRNKFAGIGNAENPYGESPSQSNTGVNETHKQKEINYFMNKFNLAQGPDRYDIDILTPHFNNFKNGNYASMDEYIKTIQNSDERNKLISVIGKMKGNV
jgi:hypothetical protein